MSDTPTERIKLLPCAYCGDGRKCCGNFDTLVDPPECRECPERKHYMNRTAAQQMPNIVTMGQEQKPVTNSPRHNAGREREGVREMNRCPDCKNEFLQQFVCTTCGAEKLYDATVATLRNQLAAAIAQRDEMKLALRDLTDAAKGLMDCKGYDLYPDGTMRPAHGLGEWVKAEDYDKLHAAASAAQAEIAMLKNEYICKCGLRVTPHRCKTGEEF